MTILVELQLFRLIGMIGKENTGTFWGDRNVL